MTELVQNVSTIGFTKTSAENFFRRLSAAGIKKLVDVRLNNTSQLAAFAKADDLAFFLKAIAGISYSHRPELAPTDGMLKAYKKDGGSWLAYEASFMRLMAERKIENRFRSEMFADTCLLCSEETPHHCHRRLVCEYLNSRWGGVLSVKHL